MSILCESCIYERQDGTNVKACNEFDNDPMKMCFEHKTIMKVEHTIQNIDNIIFIKYIVNYDKTFKNIYVWACAYFSFLHCDLHSFKSCFTTNDVHLITSKQLKQLKKKFDQ
jgi:hypothetical protein